MKKNLIPLVALLLAIGVSSFTKKGITVYLVYQSGTEKSLSSYSLTWTQPEHEFDEFAAPQLLWFRASDDNNDTILSNAEFEYYFELCDQYAESSNLLSDEFADIAGQLDLLNRQ